MDKDIEILEECLKKAQLIKRVEVTEVNYKHTKDLLKALMISFQDTKLSKIAKSNLDLPPKYLFELYDSTNELKSEINIKDSEITNLKEVIITKFDEYTSRNSKIP